MRRLKCQCGGTIVGAVPGHCPHCGAKIGRVRQRTNYWPIVAIALLFAALLAFALWLVQRA